MALELGIELPSDVAALCLAAKKARRYVLSRQWYHDRGDQIAFAGALTFRAWGLARKVHAGTYRPSTRTLFAAPKRSSRDSNGAERFTYRPLAYQSFEDETVEVALVMTFADVYESRWGDPAVDVYPKLVSYGNRLHCTKDERGRRRLPPGSSHLYRDWADDYAKFVTETEKAFNRALNGAVSRRAVVLVSTDIASFYPTISRRRLVRHLAPLCSSGLAALVRRVFGKYSVKCGADCEGDGTKLATTGLLQGPAHSGFWANVYLDEFDSWIRTDLEVELRALLPRSNVHFYARYVDDMRVIVEVDEASARRAKRIIVGAVNRKLRSIGLRLSREKTSAIIQNTNGTLLTTGQVAERMAALARRVYLPLPPEDLRDVEQELRYLFAADVGQRPTQDRKGDSKRSSAPVLDNPGVREGSRRRFAAGKWLTVATDLARLDQNFSLRGHAFGSEILRVWIEDPGQIQLLERALQVGLRPADVKRILLRLRELKARAPAYRDFVVAFLLDRATFGGREFPELPLMTFAREAAVSTQHPVLAQRSVAYLLRANRWPARRRRRRPYIDHYSRLRALLWKELDHERVGLSAIEVASLLHALQPIEANAVAVAKRAMNAMSRRSRPALLRNLLIRPAVGLHVAESWNVDVPELEGFNPTVTKAGLHKPLHALIVAGAFRSPREWLQLAFMLSELMQSKRNQRRAARGELHPFSVMYSASKGLFVRDDARVLVAYAAGAEIGESKCFRRSTSRWAYPIALVLRAAASADPRDLLGHSAIGRFSLAGAMTWLARRECSLGSDCAEILDRLAVWPGSRIKGFLTLGEFRNSLRRVAVAVTTDKSVVLSDVQLRKGARDSEYMVVVCQLPSAPSLPDDASVRRALAMALTILTERKATASGVGLVVFPELSVPRASILTLRRFVQRTGCLVLAGLELHSSPSPTPCQINKLVWMAPISGHGSPVVMLSQEKIFLTQRELTLTPPVRAAKPAVVWRIVDPGRRVAAINCYEFTHLPLRELIRGRVEALVVSANNQDVTTFDSLVESTHYDLFGHVLLVNCEQHGGSAIRAPYKESWDRRVFDIHGANLFAVNVVPLRLEDFRQANPRKKVKSAPAGFRVVK